MNFLSLKKINYLLLLSFLFFIVSCGKENLNIPTNELDKPNFESILQDNLGERAKVLSAEVDYATINGEQLYFVPIEMTFLQDDLNLGRFAVVENNHFKQIIEIIGTDSETKPVSIAKKYLENHSTIDDFTGFVVNYDASYELKNSHYYSEGQPLDANLERKNKAEVIKEIDDTLNSSAVSRNRVCIEWFMVVSFGGVIISETFVYAECRGGGNENTGGGGGGSSVGTEAKGICKSTFDFRNTGTGSTAHVIGVSFSAFGQYPYQASVIPIGNLCITVPGQYLPEVSTKNAWEFARTKMYDYVRTKIGSNRTGIVNTLEAKRIFLDNFRTSLQKKYRFGRIDVTNASCKGNIPGNRPVYSIGC